MGASATLRRIALPAFLTLAVLLGVAGWGLSAALTSSSLSQHSRGEEMRALPDYLAWFAAGDVVASGDGSRIYDLDTIGAREKTMTHREPGPDTTIPFQNPAFVALPFAALSQFSFSQQVLVLMGVEILLTALFVVKGTQLLVPATTQGQVLIAIASLSFLPLIVNAAQGQFSVLLCLAWLGLIAAELKDRPVLGGLGVALMLVKPQYALLPVLWLLYRRRWRTLSVFAGTALVLAAVSIAVVGVGQIDAYPRALLDSRHWVDVYANNQSSMFGWSGFLAQFIEYDTALHSAATLLLSLATLACVVLCWRQSPRDEAWLLRGAAATLLGSMLVNPHMNLHDLSLLLVVMICVALAMQRARSLMSVDSLLPGLVCLLLAFGPNLLTLALPNLYTPLLAVALAWVYREGQVQRVVEQPLAAEVLEAA